MKLILVLFALISVTTAHDALKGKIHFADRRYPTFHETITLLDRNRIKVIVETGTSRHGLANCGGDGCSTMIFGEWALGQQSDLYSVDIDPNACAQAKKAVSIINSGVKFFAQDSVEFLKHFNKMIDFLYLDSYDYEHGNHLPSQIHHYNEIKEAYPKLHRKSIVLLDDCDLPKGGKCRLAVEFLEQKGWKVWVGGYQILMVYYGKELPERESVVADFDPARMGRTLVNPDDHALKYVFTCPLSYKWIKASHGDVYQHAVNAHIAQEDATMDADLCFIGRSKYFGEPVHGCIYPERGYFSYPHGNVERKQDVYEVLVLNPAFTYTWEDGQEGEAPPQSLISNGQFIGRVYFENKWFSGKVVPKFRGMYFAHKGKEHKFVNYDALSIIPRQ